MPVSVPLPYREYALALATGSLTVQGVRCPRCRDAALELTSTTRRREIVLTSRGDDAIPRVIRFRAMIAVAVCSSCRSRIRVLPADIPPRKPYSLSVIERCCENYSTGASLRRAVRTLGAVHPSHTTLHAWTQGLGAHVYGCQIGDVPGSEPICAVFAETEARVPALDTAIRDETNATHGRQRARSDASRERQYAVATLLELARTLGEIRPDSPTHTSSLTEWRTLALTWRRFLCPFAFRAGIRRTSIEHRNPLRRLRSSKRATGPPPAARGGATRQQSVADRQAI